MSFSKKEFGSANTSYPNQIAIKQCESSQNTGQKLVSFGSDNSLNVLVRRYFKEEFSSSPLTLKAQISDLNKFILFYEMLNGHLETNQWLPRDTSMFLRELEAQNYMPSTVNRSLATLRTFGHWLCDEGILTKNPCRKIKTLQLEEFSPKRITDINYHRIMKVSEALTEGHQAKFSQHHRNIAIIILLNNTGLRINEVLSLKLNQLQPMGKKLVNVKCKGGKIRNIKISKEVLLAVADYIKYFRTKGEDSLFTNRYGNKISRNGIAKALNRIASHASVSFSELDKIHITPHQFRHRCGYKSRELKGDSWAAKRLGHSSLNHVERYATLSEEQEEDLVEKLN